MGAKGEVIMARQRLDEGTFIDKFINSVFNSIASAKSSSLRKAASRDPEFQKIVKDLEDSRARLIRLVEKRRQEDPEFRKDDDAVQRFYDIAARHG